MNIKELHQVNEEALLASKRLTAMEEKVDACKHVLLERIPQRHSLLCGRVCGIVWKLRSSIMIGRQNLDHNVKRLQTELGTFDYHTKEQAENLTQILCQIDTIESHGEEELKMKRKALVKEVQRLLACADRWKLKSARLRKFGEELLRQIQNVLVDRCNQKEKMQEAVPMKKNLPTEKKILDKDSDSPQGLMQSSDSICLKLEPAAEGARQMANSLELAGSNTHHSTYDHPLTLPVWKPYYQVQRRKNGIVLKASLRGIARQDIKMECVGIGTLRITGHKFPNAREYALSKFCGSPTFGRFEIVEYFGNVNFQFSSWDLRSDGTLELYVPFSKSHTWLQKQYLPSSVHVPVRGLVC